MLRRLSHILASPLVIALFVKMSNNDVELHLVQLDFVTSPDTMDAIGQLTVC
jgi:hypothetical protein